MRWKGRSRFFYNIDAFKREPILAVVGQLQFDVVRSRLENEYSVPTQVEPLALELARWVTGPEESILRITSRSDVQLAKDLEDQYVALFREPYYLRYTIEKFPELKLSTKS